MKKSLKLSKNDLLDDNPINLINEENQKLKISNFLRLAKKTNKRKKYYTIIKILSIIYIMIILLFINYSKIEIYLKKR